MSATPSAESLLRALRPASDPRLTWYGPDGERIELSGRVLDNWVAKTANFLQEELDLKPGAVVRLDLPVHWRTLVWALAVWQAGGIVEPAPAAGTAVSAGTAVTEQAGAAVIATADAAGAAAAAPPGAVIAAVALGALQLRYSGELPPGAVDYSAEVRSYGDVFFPDPVPADAPALRTADGSLSYADVFGIAPGGAERLLLTGGHPLPAVLTEAVRVWSSGGSLVLVSPAVPVTGRLLDTERVTRTA